MLGLAAVPSVIMCWGFLRLPESPRWLANKGLILEAARVLQQFRESDADAEEELQEIKNALPQEVLDAIENGAEQPVVQRNTSTLQSTWSNIQHFVRQVCQMLEDKGARKALFLGCGLMWVQQLSGINTVMVRLLAKFCSFRCLENPFPNQISDFNSVLRRQHL